MASMAYALNEEMVRGLLKSLNLTQASAAAEMGMHRQHFHRLLQSSIEPRYETLKSIARVLQVDDAHSLLVRNG